MAENPLDKLKAMREIQNKARGGPKPTSPNYCLAAAKFVAGKLIGLFNENSHLNDLIQNSSKIKQPPVRAGDMKAAWGRLIGNNHDKFNKKILAASLTPEGGVISHTWSVADQPQFWRGVDNKYLDVANDLLGKGVPLVVGVSLHGGGRRDHFVCIVKHIRDGSIWLIDSWDDGAAATPGVFELDKSFKFDQKNRVVMEAEASETTGIPCDPMFLGYYQGTKTQLPFTAVEFGAAANHLLIRRTIIGAVLDVLKN